MSDQQQEEKASSQEQDGREFEAEIKKLRDEAAKWRTKLREAESERDELKPLATQFREMEEANKTALEKALETQKQLEQELDKARKAIDRQAKQNRLLGMGVSADYLQFVDLGALPWDDDGQLEAAVAMFRKPSAAARTPDPVNGQKEQPWTWERLQAATREEIMSNMNAIEASGLFKSGNKGKL